MKVIRTLLLLLIAATANAQPGDSIREPIKAPAGLAVTGRALFLDGKWQQEPVVSCPTGPIGPIRDSFLRGETVACDGPMCSFGTCPNCGQWCNNCDHKCTIRFRVCPKCGKYDHPVWHRCGDFSFEENRARLLRGKL